MNRIISVINQKGGVGKTTLSLGIAAYLSSLGHRVLLIDADPQHSASDWQSLRDDTPFHVVQMARENMAVDAMKMAENYEYTVIDGPPNGAAISRSCIIASDFVLMPVEPSGLSDWASDLTVKHYEEARIIKPTLKCGFVVSRKIGKTVIGRQFRQTIADKGIDVLESEIDNKVGWAEAATLGLTILEYKPDSPEAEQLIALAQEIIKTLDEPEVLPELPETNEYIQEVSHA